MISLPLPNDLRSVSDFEQKMKHLETIGIEHREEFPVNSEMLSIEMLIVFRVLLASDGEWQHFRAQYSSQKLSIENERKVLDRIERLANEHVERHSFTFEVLALAF